ncbi:MAG: hypothetical protein ACREEM_11895 [Blastocatellia bacterium]
MGSGRVNRSPKRSDGAAPGFVGLDQANLRLPRDLRGRGVVNVDLKVDGQSANAVQINIR